MSQDDLDTMIVKNLKDQHKGLMVRVAGHVGVLGNVKHISGDKYSVEVGRTIFLLDGGATYEIIMEDGFV